MDRQGRSRSVVGTFFLAATIDNLLVLFRAVAVLVGCCEQHSKATMGKRGKRQHVAQLATGARRERGPFPTSPHTARCFPLFMMLSLAKRNASNGRDGERCTGSALQCL